MAERRLPALYRQGADPRRDGDIEAAWLLRRKVQLSTLLWAGFAAAVVVLGLGFGPAEGVGRTFVYMLIAIGLSMAVVRHRRANLLPEGTPDLELRPDGLVDNQTGVGLIPWPAITGIRLDQRRNRGAGNALLLLRLADPDAVAERLRLGHRVASLGMWPRTGNHHWIDLTDLDCQPAALVAVIEAAHGAAQGPATSPRGLQPTEAMR